MSEDRTTPDGTPRPAARSGTAGAETEGGGAASGGASVATLSQWQLIRRRFARHRVAVAAMFMLAVLYSVALFAEFFAPYTPMWKDLDRTYCPPQIPSLSIAHGIHVRAFERHVDPVTFQKTYRVAEGRAVPLSFFVKGEPYRLWGLIPCRRHFLGVDMDEYAEFYGEEAAEGDGAPAFYFLGADKYGRNVLSRIIYGSRISLSIGLVAIVITFIFGVTIGGISGYLGGTVDNVIQRGIEIMNSFPRLPLWLALGAAMPGEWSSLKVYFAITIVLSLLGWTRLARVVRGSSCPCARRTTRSRRGSSARATRGSSSGTFCPASRATSSCR